MQVSPSVRAVQVPDDNPLHPQFTPIYLVGRGQVLTIDSGEDAERYRWMLKGYLAATEKAEIAQSAITHYHYDHSSNLRWLRDEFAAEVHLLEASKPLLGDRLPDSGLHALNPGDCIEAGGVKLQAILTPGHSLDSMCYFIEDEGVLFTGDTVLGEGTTSVADLAAYLESLRRIRDLPNLKLICPGHGPVIDQPVERIDLYLRHRMLRERQVLKALQAGEALTSWQIMEKIYPGIDPRLRRSADGNVRAHLHKLAQDGQIKVHEGKRHESDPSQTAAALEETSIRTAVIRQAEAYQAEARRQLVARQENPPTDEWEKMPRFQLL